MDTGLATRIWKCTCTLTRVGVDRRALKQQGGGAVAQRPVHHIGVARDPANVRYTGKDVSRSNVKHNLLQVCVCVCVCV